MTTVRIEIELLLIIAALLLPVLPVRLETRRVAAYGLAAVAFLLFAAIAAGLVRLAPL